MRARLLVRFAGLLSAGLPAAGLVAVSCGGVNIPGLDLPAQPDLGADPAGDSTASDPAPETALEVAADTGGDATETCGSDGDCEGATGGCGSVTCDKAAGKCVFEVPCDDGNPCTIDKCDAVAKTCRYEPQNGGECDDGNPCTVDDGCFAGVCAGLANPCDDQNACTRDLCSPAKGGCFHEASGLGVCDDNNPCTSGDTCDGDVCAGTPTAVCDDKNPCTDDSCDPVTGKCVFMSNDAPCDDADPCTVEHACSSGKCVGTKTLDCDDKEDCTTDACVKGLGCQHAFVPGCLKCASDAECSDGNACTADYCGAGACASAPLEGAGCEDGDPCTEGDRCVGTVCAAGLPRACEDDNPCTAGECVAGTGECMQVPVPGGCDDGNACTSGDTCASGACAGSLLACEQPGPCLSATCAPATGLCETSPLPDGSSCDDGDGCTSDDACAGGTCLGRTASCDDGDPCTIDTCAAGGCQHVLIASCTDCKADADCDDRNPCTTERCTAGACAFEPLDGVACDAGSACLAGTKCVQGRCEGGQPVSCDDTNGCTTDTCDPATGCAHANNALPCNDGDKCTAGDRCAEGLCMAGQQQDCNDGNACTDDSCDPVEGCRRVNNAAPCTVGKCESLIWTPPATCAAGACPAQPSIPCNDGNPCTDDSCDPAGGCSHVPNQATCDDGDACTKGDRCTDGRCAGGEAVSCDDAKVCTDDSCDPAVGCKHASNSAACDDGNPCTVADRCKEGACASGGDANCDDGKACTIDSCDPATGCRHADSAAACDDGNKCTGGDLCGDGICAGLAIACDDKNACTDDSCDPAVGCIYSNNTRACDDGSLCTDGDTCSGGTCKAGATKTCNDGNPCTTDSCSPSAGCVNAKLPDGTACDDKNACTTADKCTAGVCGGTGLNCGDGNPCTDDTCNPGPPQACVHTPRTGTCEDHDKCTTGDTCQAGTCRGNAVDCEDGNKCTRDSCDPATGTCKHEANDGAACSDGNACTIDDTCLGTTCVGGVGRICNDGNPCTNDKCDPATGCYTVNNTATCDDGKPCTTGDVCSGGSCGGTPVVCNDTNVCTDDSCDAATGACKYVPNSSACDDGNKCTLEDRCSAGTCKGTPKSCDDGNECTNEYCYNGICFWGDVADGTPCDDESACTAGDSCQGGTCKGMPVLCLVPVCHDGGCDPGTGCWVKPVEGACEDGRACTANDTCGSNGGEWGCNPGASTCASPNPTCTGTGCQCCSLLGGCTTCNSLAADTCYATSKTSVECRCGTKPACSGLTPCCKAGGCVPKDIVTGKCPKS